MSTTLAALLYLAASVAFIMSLRGLSSPETARAGNFWGIAGMAIAIVTTLAQPNMHVSFWMLLAMAIGGGAGFYIAARIEMTALPQLVAAFHSLVGAAAVLVAVAAFYSPASFGIGVPGAIKMGSLIEMGLGTAIGAITFTGSIVAFCKLQGLRSPLLNPMPMQHPINAALGALCVILLIWFCATGSDVALWLLILATLLMGWFLIIPIGGADMPVVVSMLNSYSGWAACGIGFTLQNSALIVTGALVGSSGAILSYVMCKGMNRSIFNVILGGFGTDTAAAGPAGAAKEQRPVKSGSAEDAAFIMKNASSIIIVPGYGMAVAQAQHALREMADLMEKEGATVRYAIHPVAGRMPGHMNVLLAEANVSYDKVLELDDINRDFAQTDVAFVIGANDVTNPAAKNDPKSSIYGMPILDVEKAKTVLFIKRSMATGYAGVENELFFRDNTMMLFGDAKKVCEDIVKSMGGGSH
jgi:NAD(P) transhydrogenase subunit beta